MFSKQNYNVYHVYFTNVFVCPTHFKRQSVKHIAYIALHRRVQVMLIRVRKIQVGHDTCPAYAGVSSLGVPGVPWHTQILADQLTLFQPGGTDYAHLITTGTPGFSDLPTAL